MSAAFAPSHILIVGATGTIGRYLTDALLHAEPPFFQVTLLTTQATVDNKAALLREWSSLHLDRTQRDLGVVVADIHSDADIQRVYAEVQPDTVVLALGRGALELQTKLIAHAEASQTVRWLFPSEFGTDIEHNPQSATEKTHQVKLAVRRYIREHVQRLQVTYLVTGPFFDTWVRLKPFTSYDVSERVAHVIEDGTTQIGFCTMSDVGKFLVASLRHPETSSGKAIKVQSFVVTPAEVLQEYQKQVGGEWTVINTPLEQIKAQEKAAWANGTPSATLLTLSRIWAEGGSLYEKNDNELIGLGPQDAQTLESAVRDGIANASA